MKINRQDLKTALSVVKPGLANKEVLEQTTSFAFMNNRVISYNDELSISCPVDGIEFEGAIKAEEIYNLLNRLTKDEIDIEVEGSELRLKCGRVKAGLRLQTEIYLPIKEEIGELVNWQPIINPEQFKQHLLFAMGVCSFDISNPKLTCVSITRDGFVQGSDGFRLFKGIGEPQPYECLIPAKSVAEIIKLEPTHMTVGDSDGWVHFKTPDSIIISVRVFNNAYLPQGSIESLLNIKKGEVIEFPKTMKDMLARVRVFAKREFEMSEQIEVVIKKGRIKMKAETEGTGSWIEEKAKIKCKSDISFSITPVLFENILDKVRKCTLSKDLSKAKFTGKDWEYLIMLKADK